MFELFDGIYSEKVESGHYRIFTYDERFMLFVKINMCMDRKAAARLVRNVALQLHGVMNDLQINKRKGG